MRSTSFRTARRRASRSGRRLVAGVMVLGLALSAPGKDDAASGQAQASSTEAESGASPTAATQTATRAAAVLRVAARTGPRVGARAGTKAGPKSRRWYQVGIASWYGTRFQGRRTAGGERFDMNGMTCAHPTLPMGTWLRVTNLKNRRTAFVRVNDRGPIIEGRIVDLSFAAAQMLGMPGLGKVKLDMVRDDDPVMAKELMAQVQVPMLFGSPIR